MTVPTRVVAGLAAAALLLAALAGCGQESSGPAAARRTALNGDVYNAADVGFANKMIPHHAAALAMADLTRGRGFPPSSGSSPRPSRPLARAPEIEQMVDWLSDWGEPIPPTMRDHVNADALGAGDTKVGGADIPGMVTDEQLRALHSARGHEFETLWLQTMIEHHEGALELASSEQADGAFGPAIQVAQAVQESEQAELDHMEDLLTR